MIEWARKRHSAIETGRRRQVDVPGNAGRGRGEQKVVALEKLPQYVTDLELPALEARVGVDIHFAEALDGSEQRRVDQLRGRGDEITQPRADGTEEKRAMDICDIRTYFGDE